jgi:hypothetical protein
MIQPFDAQARHVATFCLAVGLMLPEMANNRHDTLRQVSQLLILQPVVRINTKHAAAQLDR